MNRKELKANARAAMKGAKPHPALITLAVLFILAVTRFLSLKISGDLDIYAGMMEAAVSGQYEEVYALLQSGEDVGAIAWILTLALNLMTMIVSMGYTLYTMRLGRGKNPGIGDVFDAFAFFLRAVLLSIMKSIMISLTSFVYAVPVAFLSFVMNPNLAYIVCLPLLAPMVMVAYGYRLADYIFLDNPSYPAMYCLALSRVAMKGRKWELFKLDMSFFGWYCLCIIPVAVLWVRPYRMATVVGYYDTVFPGFMEELRNRPRPTRPASFMSGGWSVPGEKKDEPTDEPEDDPDDHDWF